jgi:hypothetical protein
MFHLFFLGLLYFLPTVLATRRGHHVLPILLLNFFLGWTVIGWFVMFFWAICSYPRYCYYPYGYAPPPPPPPGEYYGPNQGYWRRY